MNDFLRPCNCVHPAEEDCEKCIGELAGEKPPEPREEQEKKEPVPAESEKKI